MTKIIIEDEFKLIKDWAQSNNIILIEGGEFDDNIPCYILPSEKESDLAIFKNLINKYEIKFINVELHEFDVELFEEFKKFVESVEEDDDEEEDEEEDDDEEEDEEEDDDEEEDEEEDDDEEEDEEEDDDEIKIELISSFKSIEHFTNECIGMTLDFVSNGIRFQFNCNIEEIEIYNFLMNYFLDVKKWNKEIEIKSNLISSFLSDDSDDDNSIDSYQDDRNASEQFARLLAENESFPSAKSRFERSEMLRNLCPELLRKKSYFYSLDYIVRKAESIYSFEIKPKKEQELKEQIQSYKVQGLKKVEIRSKLGISVDTLNKFY